MVTLLPLLCIVSTPAACIYVVIYTFACGLNSKEAKKFFPVAFGILMAGIAYCTYFSGTPDLVRYFETLDHMKNISLAHVFNEDSSFLWVQDVWFWTIAKIGDYQLLPATTAFIVYYCLSYILVTTVQDFKVKLDSQLFIFIVLLLALPFFSIINNVRNVSAFSLIVLATFRDIVEKKRNILTLLMYILPIFIHTSGSVFLLFRVFIYILMNYRILALGIVFLLNTLIAFSYTYIGYLPAFLQSPLQKAYNYTVKESVWATMTDNSITFKLIKLISLFIASCVLVIGLSTTTKEARSYNSKYNGINDFTNENKKQKASSMFVYCCYVYLLSVLTLASSVFHTPIYWRFEVGLIVALPYAYFAFDKFSKHKYKSKSLLIVMFKFVFLFGCFARSFLEIWQYRNMVGSQFSKNSMYLLTHSWVFTFIKDLYQVFT